MSDRSIRTHHEPLSGGLMTNPDAAEMPEGALTEAANAHYPLGRSTPATVAARRAVRDLDAGAILGIDRLDFPDGEAPVVLVRTATRTIAMSDDGSTQVDVTPAPDLPVTAPTDSVAVAGLVALVDGVNAPRAATGAQTGTLTAPATRRLGMEPHAAPPSFVAGGGAWHAELGNGYFWYRISEVARVDETTYRESVAGPARQYNISFASVKVYHGEFTNADTTHWRIYRSSRIDAAAGEQPPGAGTFALVGEVDAGVDMMHDTVLTAVEAYPASAGTAVWDNPTNVFAEDGTNYAEAEFNEEQEYYSVSPVGLEYPVRAFRVEMVAKSVSIFAFRLYVRVSNDNGTTWSKEKTTLAFPVAEWGTLWVGGWADPWVTDAGDVIEFANFTNFRMRLRASGSLQVDAVRVQAYGGAADWSEAGRAYPVVKVAGVIAERQHPPPVSRIAAQFQGSLVLAVDDAIRWTVPGDADAAPEVYRMRVAESREADTITCLVATDRTLLVGHAGSVWAVTQLPSDTDVAFAPERIRRLVTDQMGIVGPRAGCLLRVPEGPLQLAFYDRYHGPVGSDGWRTTPLAPQVNWPQAFSTEGLAEVVMRDDPAIGALVLYGPAPGDDTLTTRYLLDYHTGRVRAMGPADLVPARCVARVRSSGGVVEHLVGGLDGVVYRERSAPASAVMRIATRSLYLAGQGSEYYIERAYLRTRAVAGGAAAVELIMESLDHRREPIGRSMTLTGVGRFRRAAVNAAGEAFRARVTVQGAGQLTGLSVVGKGFGLED